MWAAGTTFGLWREIAARNGSPETPTLILGGMKKALITGVSGQDGSYLAELLMK